MKTSIETIWKEGFLDESALVAPQLNNLYEQKSQHIADRFLRMGKINLICIAVAAVAVLGASVAIGTLYVGALVAALLMATVVYGFTQFGKLREIDKSQDCYRYLKAFDAFLRQTIAGYTRMYRLLYPAFLLAFLQIGWSLGGSSQLVAKMPDAPTVNGVPIPLLVVALVLAGLASAFAGPLYRLDLKFVYGRAFGKLREVLADMEELRR